MKRQPLTLMFLLALGVAPANAQVRLHIELGLPPLPPLVVIQPGIQVVEGFGEEVFFHRGWYWCRRPDGWYRSRSPRSHFDWVERRRVPGALIRVPEGHYRNWHHDRPMEHRNSRPLERHDARPHERRNERHEERREERRSERREERGRERGPEHPRDERHH
jgi:hypothetical protein